ncbi:MAG: DUF4381 family protein [Verrucomicrobiota bacterium]|nr:DUF4381 family protein [Verrucomicrobiota bacterium]
MSRGFLALLSTPPPATPPAIRDIAPPVDVSPYPLWMIIAVSAGVALIAAGVLWLLIRAWRKRPPPLPPSPRSVTLGALEKLRSQVMTLDPYAFSIAVSDVLRSFIGAQYGLRAAHQTSPEFLAAISDSPKFSGDDRTLLGRFLERCDLIKFARIDAGRDESEELLRSAIAFVQGERV